MFTGFRSGWLALCLPLVFSGCLGNVGEPQGEESPEEVEVGSLVENLYSRTGNRYWTENNKIVPVCFTTTGMAAERVELQNALRRTWSRYADIRFTGFGNCPTVGTQQFIRVQLRRPPECAPGSYCPGSGGSSAEGMGALRSPTGGHSTDIVLGWDSVLSRREYMYVHEFGHVLGFTHEHDRNDNSDASDPTCNPNGSIAGTYHTTYDRNSIMHYCGSHGNNSGSLSTLDKRGVIAVYGPTRKLFRELHTVRGKNDYNGDGRADTSWYEPNTMQFVTRVSTGAGTFIEYRKDTSGWGEWSGGRLFSRGDFNGDGRTDWSWLAPWNNIFVVMLSNGVGGWTEVHTNTSGWGPDWSGGGRHFSVGDFNGDGRDDWSWYAPWTNQLIVMLSNGAGSFTSVGNNTAGWGDISNVKFFSVGDYNGDTFDDWSFYAPGSNHFIVLISAGNGRWIAEYYNNTSGWGNWSNAFHFRVGDFNGDGRDDWSWYAYWTHKHVVMLSSGAGGFSPVENYTGGWGDISDGRFFTVGDYNGDNRDDFSFYAYWANDFIVMLSNANGTWVPRGNNTSGWGNWAGAEPFVVGDTNGDNRDDWFWYAPWSNNWHVMRSNTTGNYSIVQSEY